MASGGSLPSTIELRHDQTTKGEAVRERSVIVWDLETVPDFPLLSFGEVDFR